MNIYNMKRGFILKKVALIILIVVIAAIVTIRFTAHAEKVTVAESSHSYILEDDQTPSLDFYSLDGWIVGKPKKEARPFYIEKDMQFEVEGLSVFNKVVVTVKDAKGKIVFEEKVKNNKTYTFGKEESYGTIELTMSQGKYDMDFYILVDGKKLK